MITEPIDPLLRRAAAADDLGHVEERIPGPSSEMIAATAVDDDQAPHRRRVTSRRHPRRRLFLAVVVVLLSPVLWSYGHALTGPGNDSIASRSVEWARDHHLGGIVDRAERYWSSHHQAKVGGTPGAGATEIGGIAGEASRSAGIISPQPIPAAVATPGAQVLPQLPGHLRPPAPVISPATPLVASEGDWAPLGPTVHGAQGAYVTLIRPDAIHTSVLDAVVWIDPTVLRMRQYPGLQIPGGPWDRPPNVEPDLQSQLVAAFAGGFRLRDSNGGMIIGHRVLHPMRDGGATFAISDDGVPNIGAWGTDITTTSTLDSARQSLDPIVVAGAPVADLATDANKKWGFTGPANKTAVWRSGAGIRADGSIVWVGGNGLTIETLADTLVRAGAVRGMQLEINEEWVQLNTYAVGTNGRVHGQKLLPAMQHTGNRWLTPDTRDFIAAFTR